jgi:hypothetical protein
VRSPDRIAAARGPDETARGFAFCASQFRPGGPGRAISLGGSAAEKTLRAGGYGEMAGGRSNSQKVARENARRPQAPPPRPPRKAYRPACQFQRPPPPASSARNSGGSGRQRGQGSS